MTGRVGVRDVFEAHLAARGYRADASQRAALDRLERLDHGWRAYKAQRSNALKKLLARPPVPRGVYLWGGVGRGKSFLMDAFYAAVPVLRKTRVHFHEFMRGVHRELDEVKGVPDPLDEVARRIAKRGAECINVDSGKPDEFAECPRCKLAMIRNRKRYDAARFRQDYMAAGLTAKRPSYALEGATCVAPRYERQFRQRRRQPLRFAPSAVALARRVPPGSRRSPL